ncbi:MAG TPA: diguanylate cyclase [Candidatus Baltobacteraceae bacterium]|jgi:two-component system CheB/CheR fusion protein|nr:diguanylate cyclase [Candidatus Baltobacteraceae bacterium]
MDRPREQLARLRALWDLGLSDDTPQTQIDAVLREARAALGCDYVEVWNEDAHQRTAYAADDEQHRAIGTSPLIRGLTGDKPAMFFRDPAEHTPLQEVLRSLGWCTVLLRSFSTGQSRSVLGFAWKNLRTSFVTDSELQYVDFLAHVVSRLIELNEKQRLINDKMLIDPLTGLHNRAATLDQIAVMLSSANRTGTPLGVLYVDLDGFKAVNDSYGHAFGDKAIAEAAARMRTALRRHEIAGRIGGDEFAVLVNFTEHQELEAIALRLLTAIAQPMRFGNVEVNLTASVGIAIFPQDGTSADDLLAHADSAMYVAKRRRGSGFAFFDGSGQPQQEDATPAEVSRPDEPLPDTEQPFILCFQPIVDSRTARIIAAESLIRWLDPARGLVLPDPSEEHSGISRVPAHVDREVLQALLGGEKYREILRALPIHVNVSDATEDLLDAYSASQQSIAIELPEPLVAEDPDRYVRFIMQIRERGFSVGLTNYGYAGLALRVIAELPIDFIKIGPKLVPGKVFGTGSAAAAKAAIKQAHHFGWTVIAENVEDESQREWLVNAGVDALQGYYICSPLTQSDFSNWLRYRAAQ